MKYLKELIIAALLIAFFLGGWYDKVEFDRMTQKYKDKETRLKTQYDSITGLRNKYAVEYLKLATELTKANLALSIEKEANKSLRKRNETLKNSPVKHYTDSAALREVSRLTEKH